MGRRVVDFGVMIDGSSNVDLRMVEAREDILTDGLANHGRTRLDDLVRMMSRDEVASREFSDFQKDGAARDVHGRSVERRRRVVSRYPT